MSKHTRAPDAPLQESPSKNRNRSSPAKSHICNLMLTPFSNVISLMLKAAPMVILWSVMKVLVQNRCTSAVLPTPPAPDTINLKIQDATVIFYSANRTWIVINSIDTTNQVNQFLVTSL